MCACQGFTANATRLHRLVHPLQTEVIHLATNTTDELVVAHSTRAITVEGTEEAELFGGVETQVEAIEEPRCADVSASADDRTVASRERNGRALDRSV